MASEMKWSNSQIRQDRLCSHCTHQSGGKTRRKYTSSPAASSTKASETPTSPRSYTITKTDCWVKSSSVLDVICELPWQEKISQWTTTTTRWSKTTLFMHYNNPVVLINGHVLSFIFGFVLSFILKGQSLTMPDFLIGWRNDAVRKRASWNSFGQAAK